eukprot:gene3667-4184_t
MSVNAAWKHSGWGNGELQLAIANNVELRQQIFGGGKATALGTTKMNRTVYSDLEVANMLKQMLTNYDARLRPNYTGDSLSVVIDASIMSFGKLDTLNMAYTLDMFFRQRWRDHRLQHNLTREMTLTAGTKHPADTIWVPDTVFMNSMQSTMHHVTVNNHKLDIYPDGTVFWGTRVTVSPACKLNLRSYPMDTQHCHFELVSYAHVGKDLVYSWKTTPGIKILDKTMSQFELEDFSTKAKMVGFVAGQYSVLTAHFTFKRLMGHSILQIYIPCVAVVCVSWISLWIKRTSTPARVALCITTLLTVATLWGNANSTLPRVNYIKAVDVYLLTSFVFVLCTLIEYVIVLNCEDIIIKRREKKRKKLEHEEILLKPIFKPNTTTTESHRRLSTDPPPSKLPSSLFSKGKCYVENGNVSSKTPSKTTNNDTTLADYVENFSRVLFLVVFLVFNCIYWVKYRNYPHFAPEAITMLFWFTVIVATVAQPCTSQSHDNYTISQDKIESVLKELLKGYDTRLRPNYTGRPTQVSADITVISFGNIEEVNMVFPVDMYLRQRWNDPRLKHSLKRPLILLMGKGHPANYIWVPDTVIANSINSKMHHVTVSNDKLDIYPDGSVFWGTRISSVGSCRLDLRSYPMDTQTCKIGIESYGYPTGHILYNWHSKPGVKILSKEMSQYELVGFKTQEKFVDYIAGNYSVLSSAFTFKRLTGSAILRIYIPTIAIVAVSWISVWIDQDCPSARVFLCITTLLTLSTIWGAINSTLPRVSYIKAVDLFFMVSFVFVFYTLVQFVLVLNISKRSRARKDKDDEDEEIPMASVTSDQENDEGLVGQSDGCKEGNPGCKELDQEEKQFLHCPGSKSYQNVRRRFKSMKGEAEKNKVFVKKESRLQACKMDLVARVALPVGYLMFNIYYWAKYLEWRTSSDTIM